MALYDPNDTVDVLHPQTGQLITLPSSVARAAGVTPDMIVPRQQFAEYGSLPGVVTGGVVPPAPPDPPPPIRARPGRQKQIGTSGGPAGAEIAPSTNPASLQAAAAATTPLTATAPAPAAAPSQPAPDEPMPELAPMTTDQLRKEGETGVLNKEKAALQEGDKAGKQLADVEGQFHDAMAGAYHDQNEHLDSIAAQRAKDAQANLDAINQKSATQNAAIDAYSKMKIDRSVDHPVLSALGVLLSSIGAGMEHSDRNLGLEMMQKAIERKVQTQMDDRSAAGQAINLGNQQLGNLRQTFSDRNAYFDGLAAAEYKRTIALGDELTQKSQSQQVKANWMQHRADLATKAAELQGSALDKQIARDQSDRAFAEQKRHSGVEEGIAGGHLALARKSLDEQIREHDLERQDKLDQIKLEYDKLGQKDKAAKVKDVADNGVFDATSGNGVLDSQGQAKMDQADKYEAAARQAKPEDAVKYRQQAQQLRNDAEVNNTFTIADKDTRREIVKSVGAGQKLIDITDRIKQTLAQDPSSVDRSTWAGLETDFESAKADWIEAHKGKPSSREFDAISPMFGDSPMSLSARVAGRGKMIEALNHLKLTAIGDTTTDLRANGYKGQWRPRSIETPSAATISGKTSQELGSDATPGVVTGAFGPSSTEFGARRQTVGARLFGGQSDPSVAAENAAPLTSTGLAPEDEKLVRSTMARFGSASDQQASDIVNRLAAYAQSPRESVANGVIGLLRENPDLYKQVLAKLPADTQKSLREMDQAAESELLKRRR